VRHPSSFQREVSLAAKQLNTHNAAKWDAQLDGLQVQSKFKDIVMLESDCLVWNRIISGLPSKQMSFVLCAGSDTLPCNATKFGLMENSIKSPLPPMWLTKPNYPPYLEQLCFCSQPGKIYLEA